MFGFLKKKRKEAVAAIGKIENRDLMEAIVGASVLVAFADGDCSADELNKLSNIVENNPNLKHFGSEIGKTIDSYAAQYESSARMAKLNLMKEVTDVSASEDEKQQVLIIAIDIAEADGQIDDDERAVLDMIAKEYGLKVDNYL